MSEIYIERQYWVRWPRVLIACKKRGKDESGNLIVERRRYVPEGGDENYWKAMCRKVSSTTDGLRAERDRAIAESMDARGEMERKQAEVDGLEWAVKERDDIIRELEKLLPCASRAFRAEMEERIEEIGIGEA